MSTNRLVSEIKNLLKGNREFVIFEFDNKRNYYFQFLCPDAQRVICEAVSNAFLSEASLLNVNEVKKIVDYGFVHDSGSENFVREFILNSDSDIKKMIAILYEIIETVYQVKEYDIDIKTN